MPMSDHDYMLLFTTEGGVVLANLPMDVDWQPAIEWARLEALRQAARPQRDDAGVGIRIEPEWHPMLGEPYVKGFGVRIPEKAGNVSFSNSYFVQYAQAGSSALVEQKKLGVGERFRYFVLVAPREIQRSESTRIRFRAATSDLPHVSDARMSDYLSGAVPMGVHHPSDMPAFMPRQVLEEVTEIYREQSDRETGGVLVGMLRRDRRDGQVFLEVTAQIPALHTNADPTRLTFTADTWKAVRAALALRKRGEQWTGWWHTHPVRSWMAESSGGECDSADSTRLASGGFFSVHDVAVHRTAFVSAYCVALVVSDMGPGRETYSLFGWRAGVVASRGYHLLQGGAMDQSATRAAVMTALAKRNEVAPLGLAFAAECVAREPLTNAQERRFVHE
jgi:proteasome lid subunit RPN8/RPN11